MDKKTMKNGQTVSRLGMGLMRLPEKDGKIDYDTGFKMIDTLMAAGVNYYDTAYYYHGGKSQVFAKDAIVSRFPRESFKLATKMPLGEVEKIGGVEKTFNDQLNTLGTDYIDFYLLHGINKGGYDLAKRLGADVFLKKMKEEGVIGKLGFSFHGDAKDLPIVLDADEWDFVQVQLNYYDWYAGDGKALYEDVRSRGVPLIVMEPVRGGGLSNCHEDIKKIFVDADKGASVASWALRWVGSLDDCDIVLSGMSDMAQVNENIGLFSPLKPLDAKETKVIETAVARFKELPLSGCTACKYCAKCPQSIDIPFLLNGYDDVVRFGSSWNLMNYRDWHKDKLADKCTECGVCEAACPQGLNIISQIRNVFEKYT